MNITFYSVVLGVIFILGALVALVGIVVAIVSRVRDHRTPEERRADQYGDMPEGTFKITPGSGLNNSGGGTVGY